MTRPTTLPAPTAGRPTLAVWKFASCDGCQLSLLDCERELVAVADRLAIASFPEASTAVVDGPYDVSLVEGSISTPDDIARIERIRRESRVLVTIGACATAGGIQALRNGASVDDFMSIVYAHPEYISTLATSTAIADHVPVDFELRGCPIDRAELLEVITAFVNHRPPNISSASVCTQCKTRAIPCVMVATGTPCLGPVTHAGCDALCPSYTRGCYGCFGPAESANTAALDSQLASMGMGARDRERLWRGFAGWAPPFRHAGDAAGEATRGDREART